MDVHEVKTCLCRRLCRRLAEPLVNAHHPRCDKGRFGKTCGACGADLRGCTAPRFCDQCGANLSK